MQLTKKETNLIAGWLGWKSLVKTMDCHDVRRRMMADKMIEELRADHQDRLIKIETIIARNNTCSIALYLDDPDLGFTKLFEVAGQSKREAEVQLILEYLTLKKVPVQLTIELEDFFSVGLEEKVLSFFTNYPPEIRHVNFEGCRIDMVETGNLYLLDISLTHRSEYHTIKFRNPVNYKTSKVIRHPNFQKFSIIFFKE